MAEEKTSKQDIVKKWFARIQWAESSVTAKHRRWKIAQDIYETYLGKEDDPSSESRDRENEPRVPLIYSVFATMLPALFSAMPKVKASAKRPQDEDTVDLVESVIEDVFDKTKIYQEVKRVVLSAIVKGTGFLKIGFSAETETVKKSEADILKAFSEEQPFGTALDEQEFVQNQGNLIDTIITEEGVWVKYVPNEFIFLDPEARDLESSNFLIHLVLLSREELKKRYPDIDMDKVVFEVTGSTTDITKPSSTDVAMKPFLQSPDAKRAKVYEIWDKQNQRFRVMTKGIDSFLEDDPWPFENMASYPFSVLALAPKIDTVYGMELIYILKDADKIHEEMIKSREDDAQRVSSGFLAGPGAFSNEEEKRALQEPGHKKINFVGDITQLREYVIPSAAPQTFGVSAEMRALIEEVAHVSAQTRQTSQPGKQTATEVSATVQAGDILTFFKVREIERLIEDFVAKIVPLIKEFYDQPELVKIDAKFGVPPIWQEWTGSLLGEYTFTVRAGSSAHQDDALRLQQKLQSLQMIGNFADSGAIPNPQILLQALLTDILDLQGINAEIIEQAFKPPEPLPIPEGLPAPEESALPIEGIPTPEVPTPGQTAPTGGVETPSPGPIINV